MPAINYTSATANINVGAGINSMGALTQVPINKWQSNTEFITQLAQNPFALQQLEQQSVFVIGLHHCKELVYEIYNVLQYFEENYGEIKGAFRFPAESYYYYVNKNNEHVYGRRRIIYSSAVLLVIFESVYSARKACGLITTPMYTSIIATKTKTVLQEQVPFAITENKESKEKIYSQLEQPTESICNAGEAPEGKTETTIATTTAVLPLPTSSSPSEFVNRRGEELLNQVAPKTTMASSSSTLLIPSQTNNINNNIVLLPSHYPTHVNKLTYCSQVIQIGNNRIKIEPASHFALSSSAAQRCLQTFISPQIVSSQEQPHKPYTEMSPWHSSRANSANRNMYDNSSNNNYFNGNGDNSSSSWERNNTNVNSLYNPNTYNWPSNGSSQNTNRLSSQYGINKQNTKGSIGKTDEAGYFSATSRLWTLFFSPFASSSSSSSSSSSTFESCPSSLLMSYLVDWSAAKAACKRYEAIVIHDYDILPFAKGLTTQNDIQSNNNNNNKKRENLGTRWYGNNNINNNETKGNDDEVEDNCTTSRSRLLNTRDIWGKRTVHTNSTNIPFNSTTDNGNNCEMEQDNPLMDRVKRTSLDFSKKIVYKRVRSDAIDRNNDHVINTHDATRNNCTKSNNNINDRDKNTFPSEENDRNTRQKLEGQRYASTITRDDNNCNDFLHQNSMSNLENVSIFDSVSHKARNALNYFNNWRHHSKNNDATYGRQTQSNNNINNVNNVNQDNRASGKVIQANNNISSMYMPQDDEFIMKESVQERYFREKYSKPKWLSLTLPWSSSTNRSITSEGNPLIESENWIDKVSHTLQSGLSSVVKCFALPGEQPLQFDYARGELTRGERCNDHTNLTMNSDNDNMNKNNYASGAEESRQFTAPLQNRE